MKIKAAIFDYDGTLMDTMWFWDSVGERILEKLGLPVIPEFRDRFFILSQKEAAELFRSEFGVTKSVEEIVDIINGMVYDFYKNEAGLKDGVLELLKYYKSKGIKIALATATDRYLVDFSNERLDLNQYFDFIITCLEAGASKTSPDIYLKAAQALDTPVCECAVFEDAVGAAHTAKNAGFYTVGVYDKASEYNREEMQSFCDEYVMDFSQISPLE